jgi:tRNA dimethylallyltransferase
VKGREELPPARIVVVLGPTASGKSEIAARLAERFGGEVVGCDSMQVYRGFDAGTGKPSPALRARAPHQLIDVADPARDFSLGDYARLASRAIARLLGSGKLPVIAGGTGLYLQGCLRGVFDGPPRDEALRRRYLLLEARRPERRTLHRLLSRVDPRAAARLAPADLQRIVRALEVHRATGRPLSEHLERQGFGDDRWPAVKVGLVLPRPLLSQRIEERVDEFLAEGWEDEVRSLLASGPPATANAWKALGYRQIAQLVRGEIGREEARAAIVLETRRYAKRQMTWFRREPGVSWFEHEGSPPYEAIERLVADRLGRA